RLSSTSMWEYPHHPKYVLQSMETNHSNDGSLFPPCTPHPSLLPLSCRASLPFPAAYDVPGRCSVAPDKNGSEQLQVRFGSARREYQTGWSCQYPFFGKNTIR